IVLNKFEKRGAEDALRDVRKQWRRNHTEQSASTKDADVPVYPTIASRFNDPGVNRLFGALLQTLEQRAIGRHGWLRHDDQPVEIGSVEFKSRDPLIPAPRSRYLSEIAEGGRRAREQLAEAVVAARQAYARYESLKGLRDAPLPAPFEAYADA